MGHWVTNQDLAYLAKRWSHQAGGSLVIEGGCRPTYPAWYLPLLIVPILTAAAEDPLPDWWLAAMFAVLVAYVAIVFLLEPVRRHVVVDPATSTLTIRDSTFGWIHGESAIPFAEIRDIRTIQLTGKDPKSEARMLTLHLAGHDRYLIHVAGTYANRDLEERLRALVLGGEPHTEAAPAPA